MNPVTNPPTINLPSSKSISARALIINALAADPCELRNLSDCDDTVALQGVLQGGSDIGAAGTAMRFATALLAATPGAERTLTGTARMLERPIGVLVDALRHLGADIEYAGREGYPPLRIRGRQLHGGVLNVPASISSQYISALMMIAPTLERGLQLQLDGHIASRPYIDMTRALMAEWGAQAEWTDEHTLYIYNKPYRRTEPYEVEADWSAASYFLAMNRDVLLPGLRDPSVQGDSVIVHFLRLMDVAVVGDGYLILDFKSCPDIAQTMVVAACLAGCEFYFTGLESLRIKETDRMAALIAECRKFGWELHQPKEGCLTYSPNPVHEQCAWPSPLAGADSHPLGSDGGSGTAAARDGVCVATYKDHRMAMAFALCLRRFPATTFDDPMVVTKSFPNFWDEFRKLLP